MAVKAILKIDGKEFNVLEASYNFSRYMDTSGYVAGLVHFETIRLTIAFGADTFFLHWMFTPALQKSGTISYYDEEDSIKKIKQVVFGGAFCMGYREIYHGGTSLPLHTILTLSAGGIKIEESIFRFPWFKGPLVAERDEVMDTAVEFESSAGSPGKEKPPATPKEVIVSGESTKEVKKEREGHPVNLEDISATEPKLMGGVDYVYEITDKKTGAKIAEVVMPNDPSIGPSFHIDAHKAYLPSGNPIRLKPAGKFSFTAVTIGIAINMFEKKFGKKPDSLPGQIIDSNIDNFKISFLNEREKNQLLTDEELFQIAIRNTSFGKHRSDAGYGDFQLIKIKKRKEEVIDGKLYQGVPWYVEIDAKKIE